MLLRQLYSEPAGLLATTPKGDGVIRYKTGINYIFGKKDAAAGAKNSLNGIGKSLSLDLIDFCLGCGFVKRNARLFEARDNLKGYKIALDFEVDGKLYTAKRSVDNPNEIEFGPHGATRVLDEGVAKEQLCDLIFLRKDYPGYYSNGLLRSLLPFFLKIHRTGGSRFVDPVPYLPSTPESKLNQFHLFFLDIDNTLIHKNFELQEKMSATAEALKAVRRQVTRMYGVKRVQEIDSKIDSLDIEVKRIEKGLKVFRLADTYRDAERRADALTKEIKAAVLQNHSDHIKVTRYEESYALTEEAPNVRDIKALYAELNQLLSEKVGKTIEEAIAFRTHLAKSRKDFLAAEIKKLKSQIAVRDQIIASKDVERASLFEFLEAKRAIQDLTDAFKAAEDKKKELNDLRARIRLYSDLQKEQADQKAKETALWQEILVFLDATKDRVSEFRRTFFEVYRELYQASESESAFSIVPEPTTQQKLRIDVKIPAKLSEGKNPGRTLIYDIAVLMHMLTKKLRGPRFLAHDGIFNGMDKAHFVALVNFLNRKVTDGERFQYLIPINEEGTLDEKFGKVDAINPDTIEKEAVLVLTPKHKLLGKSWD